MTDGDTCLGGGNVQPPNPRLQRTPSAPLSRQPLGDGKAAIVLILGCAALAGVGRNGWAQTSPGAAVPALEPALQEAMAERTRANLEGDIQKIDTLMAPEYVQTDIGGRVQSRAEWLASYFKPLAELIRAGKFRWETWDERDIQTRSFGDMVVVTGNLTLKGKGASAEPGRGWVASAEGSIGPATLSFTRVWIKRDGKWLLAAIHNAIPQQPK